MALQLVKYHTSDGGPQLAVADVDGDTARTVAVLSETDADGLTPGQLTLKHGVAKGTNPGEWSD